VIFIAVTGIPGTSIGVTVIAVTFKSL
jgi:hypothetical protein